MPLRTSYPEGVPSWTDLATPDLDASKQFYDALFGWDLDEQDTGSPDMPYVIAEQDGKRVAGMMRLSPEMQSAGMPPVWSTHVTVDDVDAAAAKVRELGGKVLSDPMDVMTQGRMAVAADPTGAVFCLWQPKDAIGAELVNDPNSLVWTELVTSDVERAKEFYGGLFGWTTQTLDAGEKTSEYTVWQLEGQETMMGGAMAQADGMAHWGVYFAVADCDAMVERAKELGATLVSPPIDVPGVGRSAGLVDPQGAAFTVMKMANVQR